MQRLTDLRQRLLGNLPWKIRKSLRLKIIAWSFVPTVIILIAVAWVTFDAYQQVTEELVIERDREVARLAASQLAGELTRYTGLLTEYSALLAELAQTTDVQEGPDAQRTALSQAKGRFETFDAGVLVLDNQGHVVTAEPARPDIIGKNWSDRPYFRQMLRFPTPFFSNIVDDGPDDLEAIAVAVPIKGDQGQFLGVIVGMFRIDPTAISPFYEPLSGLHVGQRASFYLVDGNGRAIYHSQRQHIGEDFSIQPVVQQVSNGETGSLRTRDAEGQAIIASFAPVPGTDWGFVTQESWDALISTSAGHRRSLFFLLVSGIVAPALVVAVGVRRITRPITELIDATQEVADGRFNRTITAKTGDELEELAAQFNRMSAQLQEIVGALERRVTDLKQTQHALQESEMRYRTLFDGVPVGLYRAHPDGRLVDVNPTIVQILGYRDRSTLLGDNVLDLYVDPKHRARWQRLMARDAIVQDFEIRIQRRDGRIIWVNNNARAVKDEQGQTLFFEGSFQEITERKHAEAERERLLRSEREQRQLTEALQRAGAALSSTLELNEVLERILDQVSAVVPHDAANIMLVEGKIAHVLRRRGYERFAGQDTAMPTQFNVADMPVLSTMLRSGEPLTISHVERDEAWTKSVRARTWIQSYAGAPIRSRGRIGGFLNVSSATPGFFTQADARRLQAFADQAAIAIENAQLYHQAQQELGERKRAETEVRKHRDHLEELVAQRTAALVQTNAQLQQEILQRGKLIAELDAYAHTVAHDLRNPLATMMGYARLLQEEDETLSDETRDKCKQTIVRTGHKMNNIIDELLLLASVRKGEIKAFPLDMGLIVAEAQKQLIYMIEEFQAQIVAASDWPMALGHAPWVEEVWTNYLSNAIKYGGRPPRVKLGATVPEGKDGQVRFWIRDNGPGLTSEEQEKLFTPFTRLDKVRVEGHGLGLTIVQRIIEKLGGEVGLESEVGRGSTFYFTLPGVRDTRNQTEIES